MIYLVEAVGADRIKIGYTDDKFERRLHALKTASCFPLKVLGTFPGDMALEAKLHKVAGFRRASGEWFQATPGIRSLANGDLDAAIERIEAEASEWLAGGERYAEQSYAMALECIRALVAKYGAVAVANACGSDQSTVRGWLRGRSRISFDRLVALVNADREIFAPFIELASAPTGLTADDHRTAIEHHAAALARMVEA